MLAKAEWFAPRKWGGWGLTPRTWQGWVYILVMASPLVIIQSLPIEKGFKEPLMIGWTTVLIIDILGIMYRLKKDEREMMHEALAERNAMWAIVTALGVGVAYQAAMTAQSGVNRIDPVTVIALGVGVVVKAISHWWLRDK